MKMPYPNEHACRLNEPGKYTSFARKNCEQKSDDKCIDVIYGISEGKSEIQALRYPKGSWDADAARSHCSGRGGSFEAASEKSVTRTIFKTMNAKIIDNPSIENKSKSKTNRQRQGAYTAVAMVGDQFWNKGRTKEFCLWDGVKKGYKTMNNTKHNLDHGADPHGNKPIRIRDIVGKHFDTELDEKNKQMITYIKPWTKMPECSTWKAYIDSCNEDGEIPNISIEAMVTQEQMMAKDIPVEGLDYKQYSIDDDDLVWVETGYRFVGAATVYMGACDDSDGCGILSSIDDISPNSESMVNNETVILQTDISKSDAVVSNCDCNTATMTVNVKNEVNNIIEAEKMPEEKPIVEEKPDLRLQEIETLKSKLTTCGEVRQQIVDENVELKKKLAELDNKYQVLLKETQELQEKLNKPITTIEEPQKNETVRDRGIKALEQLTGKKFK
jgi:hypothetical protein